MIATAWPGSGSRLRPPWVSSISTDTRGAPTGGAAPDRSADIVASNESFQQGLKTHSNVNPIWANYHLVGTVWLNANSLKPGDGSMSTEAIGSVSLANATLETYVQGNGHNCFMCHNTAAGPIPKGGTQPLYPGKDINLSHILLSPFFP